MNSTSATPAFSLRGTNWGPYYKRRMLMMYQSGFLETLPMLSRIAVADDLGAFRARKYVFGRQLDVEEIVVSPEYAELWTGMCMHILLAIRGYQDRRPPEDLVLQYLTVGRITSWGMAMELAQEAAKEISHEDVAKSQ